MSRLWLLNVMWNNSLGCLSSSSNILPGFVQAHVLPLFLLKNMFLNSGASFAFETQVFLVSLFSNLFRRMFQNRFLSITCDVRWNEEIKMSLEKMKKCMMSHGTMWHDSTWHNIMQRNTMQHCMMWHDASIWCFHSSLGLACSLTDRASWNAIEVSTSSNRNLSMSL